MLITGVDFHTRFQQIAMLDTETGEVLERLLERSNGERRSFTLSCKSQCGWAWKQPARRNGSGDAGQARARALGGRFRRDSRANGAKAEDGCARCSACS